MKITIEHYGYTFTAEGSDDQDLDHVLGRMIIPLIINMGYSREGLAKMFVEGLPSEWDSAFIS